MQYMLSDWDMYFVFLLPKDTLAIALKPQTHDFHCSINI